MLILAGYGFVGRAYYELLSTEYDVEIVDPKYTDAIITDFPYAAGLVCCVGTPSGKDGNYDTSALHSVISQTPKDIPILIKSTITIEVWDELKSTYPQHNITFSPEFLRARTAIEDVFNARYVILAGDNTSFWGGIFQDAHVGAAVFIAEPEEAIVAKQFINAFLATKVSFFNQLFDYCESNDIDYEAVKHLMVLDKRIGNSHTTITPTRGWGGYCFPKDTSALLKTTNTSLSVLSAACEYNEQIRKKTQHENS